MKTILPLALLSIVTFSQFAMADGNSIKLSPVSAHQKLTAKTQSELDPFKSEPVVLNAGKGEWESFQFVIETSDTPINKLEIRPTRLVSTRGATIPASQISFWRENFVYVPKPSGNRVLQPKWWPDALIPYDLAKKDVPARSFAVFWATIKVPKTTDSGDYFAELDFSFDGAPRRLAVALTVENRLAVAPSIRANVALYYDSLRDWYKKANIEFTEEKWAAQKRRFYDFLLDYHLNAYDLPVDWKSEDAGKILRDPRVLSIRVPPLDSPDFEAARAKLAATDTISKAYYYWIDEPHNTEQFARVRDTTTKLRALGIKHLVTAHPTASLENAVDIWCPNIGDFFGIGHVNARELAAQRAQGRETWFYTMVEPKTPYPTWLLDDEASAILDYAKIIKRYNFGGFVYSMVHGWGENPLENLQSYESTNGDGTLLYPAELVGGTGPMPSIRLMLMREMLEGTQSNAIPSAPNLNAKLLAGNDVTNAAVEFSAPAGKIVLDGNMNEWNAKDAQTFSGEGRPETPSTSLYLRHDSKFLYVGIRAQKPLAGDWVGVEIAKAEIDVDDTQNRAEKWRFVTTLRGNSIVERYSREGRARFDVTNFRAAIQPFDNFYNVEMQIPLDLVTDLAKGQRVIRFNALRRFSVRNNENGDLTSKVTVRAYADGGDPYLMPLLLLAHPKRAN
jgi:hypothetical protein